jgi:outer membrane protein TolC
MSKQLVALLIASVFAAVVRTTHPASAQTPLTLGAVLRAVTTPSADDASTPGLAAAAAARSGVAPSLQAGAALAPDVGVPSKYTIFQELSVDVGSNAGRLGRAHSAQAVAAQVVASLATSRRSAAQNGLTAFFALATDQVEAATAAQNVELAGRTLRATMERRRVGVAPRVDEDRARTALRSSEADLASANAAREADRAALRELLSTASVGDVVLPDVGTVPGPDVARDRALRSSPVIASSDAELRNAEASLLIARGEAAPGLSVGAGAALTGDSIQKTFGPIISATLTLPISINAARAARGAAQARVAAAQVASAQARREAVASALRLRAQAVAASARLAPLGDALDSARRVADAAVGGYRLGAVSSADLIVAQTQLASARAALDTAILQASQAYASLQIEIGELPS